MESCSICLFSKGLTPHSIMSSRPICAVAHVRISLLKAESHLIVSTFHTWNTVCLSICLSMDTWIALTSWLLWICGNELVSADMPLKLCFQSFWIYVQGWYYRIIYMLAVFYILRGVAVLFSILIAPFPFTVTEFQYLYILNSSCSFFWFWY